jgi:hypothetical protein
MANVDAAAVPELNTEGTFHIASLPLVTSKFTLQRRCFQAQFRALLQL